MSLTSIFNDPFFAADFEVVRVVETVNRKGRAEFTETREPVTGCIQHAPGEEREALPEEDRAKETILVFAPVLLSQGEEETHKGADIIVWKGKRYRVQVAEDWMHVDGFSKALAIREGK